MRRFSDAGQYNNEDERNSFKAQLGGEFMLESDFGYLQSILPPLVGGDMNGGFDQAGFGLMGGFGG